MFHKAEINSITKKTSVKFLVYLLIAAVMTVGIFPVHAVAEAPGTERKAVRVAVPDSEIFIQMDDQGNPVSGYAFEYIETVAAYSDWDVEYIAAKGFSKCLDMLVSGEVDVFYDVSYTPERAENMLFSTIPMGSEDYYLYCPENSEDIHAGDIASLDGMRVGVTKNTVQNASLTQWCLDNGITLEQVVFDSVPEKVAALDSGEIDLDYEVNLMAESDFSALEKIDGSDFYLVANIGRPDIAEDINSAQSLLLSIDRFYQTKLTEKYFSSTIVSRTLTASEAGWVSEHDTLTVGYLDNYLPFSDISESGGPDGLVRDIVPLMLKNIRLDDRIKIEYKGFTDSESIRKALSDGTVDTFFPAYGSIAYAKGYSVLFSDSVLGVSIDLAYKSVYTDDTTAVIAVNRHNLLQEYYTGEYYPGAEILYCDTIGECLEAVENGRAGSTILNGIRTSALLKDDRFGNLRTVRLPQSVDFCFAVKSGNSALLSLLNRAIVNTEEASALTYSYGYVDSMVKYTTMDYIRDHFAGVLLFSTAFAAALVFLITASLKNRKLSAAKRKIELQNEEIREALNQAERASRGKSDFLAQMSHEIRTPMNAITGMVTLAQMDEGIPETTREYLLRIDESSKVLLELINNILDMSSIENGKLKIAEEQFNFRELLSGLVTVFSQQASQKNVDFRVRLKGVEQEELIGDELRVRQILLNLLSNAVKFTPSGGTVDMSVVQAALSQDKVTMRFIVRDTGIGMSRDMRERLFRPFEQEDAGTARKHGGSGLGMSITYRLVRMMGGTIDCESAKGDGTTFTVDLTFRVVKGERAVPYVASDFENLNVLAVDDDEDALAYCGALLDNMHIRHDTAISAEVALEKMGEAEESGAPFNMLIIDWQMPDMDGIELTRNIRDIFGRENIILIASAYNLADIKEEGKSAGADFFISKPLFQSSLFDLMMKITGSPGAVDERKTHYKDFDFTGRRVLLAEDVVLNMEVAIKLLKLVGLQVNCAEDGRQAVDIFEKSDPGFFDCILMDVNMPIMDGYEATRLIRNSGRPDAKTIPIFAMTANAFTSDVTDALNAGMNGHLAKPIEADVLYRTLDAAFRGGEEKQ